MNRCIAMTARPAFTLVELMISLALMVILMLGVNYIFSAVGNATSSAQAVSKNTKDAQGAQTVFYDDFTKIVQEDGPCLLISSQFQAAFRTQKDQLSAIDQTNPLIIDNGAGGTLTQSAAEYGDRSHRTDILSFFAQGLFNRQTGNDGVFVANQSAREAWIWYGHLMLADNGTGFKRMGEGDAKSNPNNFYASQWALGRMAMLLVEPDKNNKILDATPPNGIAQHYIKKSTGRSPLSQTDTASESVADDAAQIRLAHSRYDLAATSITGFREILQNSYAPPATTHWWRELMLDDTDTTVSAATNALRRFQAVPYVKKPLDSKDFASMSPIFLPGCAQFIVEYAGDFLHQNTSGANIGLITGPGPDGETDFIAVGPAATATKQIRWYGMPRDTNKDGHIWGTPPGGGTTNDMVDVVPLRDVAMAATPSAMPVITPPNDFIERAWPTGAPVADYLVPGAITPGMSNPITDSKKYQYQVAWGPDRGNLPYPSMIRITIVLDEPNGRLTDPPSYEYVFRLK